MRKRLKGLLKLTKGLILTKLKSFSLDDSIIIVSSPRGGSTWLTETLNNIPNSVINWEPFHPKYGVIPSIYNWGSMVYLNNQDDESKYIEFVKNIFSFKFYSGFTTSFCSIQQVINARIVITKSVRTTRSLPWMVRSIKFTRKPIYLLRHPIPTSISHIKAFGERIKHPSNFKPIDAHNSESFNEHLEYLHSLNSNLELEIAIWCINNTETLNSKESGKWMTVFYENLLLDPKKETIKILETLNITEREEIIEQINFRKPSKTDLKNDLQNTALKQLSKWENLVSQDEKDSIQRILIHFNINAYSAFQTLPLTNNSN